MAIRLNHLLRSGCLVFLVFAAISAGAQIEQIIPLPESGIHKINLDEYKLQLLSLRGLVAACKAAASACDAAKVGGDDLVSGPGGEFTAHWSWLREGLAKAKDAKTKDDDRDGLLAAMAERLDDQAREAGLQIGSAAGPPAAAVPFKEARARADKVLSGAEFRHVTKNPFWEKLAARIDRWIGRLFGGVESLGHHAPWLGPLIEWGFVALALAGLLVWVLRVMSRQRLQIRLAGEGASVASWQEAARDWAKAAESSAAAGEWREAVHALYWASVVELDGRRVWRRSNARTPREYLRLLRPDAPQYPSLRVLTQLLERVWYGFAPAGELDYDQALRLYEALRTA